MSARTGESSRRWLQCVAVLAACGCGSSGADATSPPPLPPSNLQLSWVDFDRLALNWSRSPSRVDRYVAEGRIEAGPWASISEQIPNNAFGGYLAIAPSTPELVSIGVRMYAVSGSLASDYTPEAVILRGLRSPSRLSAHAVFEDVELAWTQESSAASSVRVERAEWNAVDQTHGPFQVVATLSPSATSWRDTTTDAPGYVYQYRVTNLGTYRGTGVESLPAVQIADAQTELPPPVDFQARLVGGDVQMSWTPRTRIAVVQRVERSLATFVGWVDIAELDAHATTYVDPSPLAGPYLYRVINSLPTTGFGTVVSDPVAVQVPPPVGAWGLEQSMMHVPYADGVALGSDGAWWFSRHWAPLGNFAPADSGVWELSPTGWSGHRFPGPWGTEYLVEPGVVLDPFGQPHAIWLLDASTGPSGGELWQLRHSWRDGGGWHDEPIADRVLFTNGISYTAQFGIDGSGAVHALWDATATAGGVVIHLRQHATNAGGGWAIADVPITLLEPSPTSRMRLSVAPDGTAHVAVIANLPGTNDSAMALLRRHPDGTWSEEIVPTGPISFFDMMWMLARDANRLDLLYTQRPSNLDPTTYRFQSRTAAGWGPSEPLGEANLSGYAISGLASSADGARRAALVELVDGLHLATWEARTGWTTSRIHPTVAFDFPWVGFDTAGAVHVLLPGGIPGADGFTDRIHLRSTR